MLCFPSRTRWVAPSTPCTTCSLGALHARGRVCVCVCVCVRRALRMRSATNMNLFHPPPTRHPPPLPHSPTHSLNHLPPRSLAPSDITSTSWRSTLCTYSTAYSPQKAPKRKTSNECFLTPRYRTPGQVPQVRYHGSTPWYYTKLVYTS